MRNDSFVPAEVLCLIVAGWGILESIVHGLCGTIILSLVLLVFAAAMYHYEHQRRAPETHRPRPATTPVKTHHTALSKKLKF